MTETPDTQDLNDQLVRSFMTEKLHFALSSESNTGVPNLGYICLSEGVHLRLAIEEKNITTYYLFPNIYTYISE